MQAVILAGGLGTRLRPLTERTPKPMVEVGGRPFLEYMIEFLAAQDFTRILLLVGYLGEHISNHFGDGRRFGIQLDYAWERTPLGTGGALRAALDKLDPTFLALYGDSFLPIDYREVVAAFHRSSCAGLIVAYDNTFAETGVANNVSIDHAGLVARYAKGESASDLTHVEAGVLCFHRDLFLGLPADEFISLEHRIYPELIKNKQLASLVTRQRFFDIGTPERLREFVAIRS